MTDDIAPFDIAAHLDDDEMIAEYLSACIELDDADTFLTALGHVARAKGMTDLAARSGLSRESLYRALASGSHPRLDTVRRVVGALGLRLAVVPASEPALPS